MINIRNYSLTFLVIKIFFISGGHVLADAIMGGRSSHEAQPQQQQPQQPQQTQQLSQQNPCGMLYLCLMYYC